MQLYGVNEKILNKHTRRRHDFFTLIDIANQQSSCSYLYNSFYNTPTDGAVRMVSSSYLISSGFWPKEKQSVRSSTYIANRWGDSIELCLTPKSNFKNFENTEFYFIQDPKFWSHSTKVSRSWEGIRRFISLRNNPLINSIKSSWKVDGTYVGRIATFSNATRLTALCMYVWIAWLHPLPVPFWNRTDYRSYERSTENDY